MDEPDLALAEIKRHLLDFIGTHTWEELCREWTLRASVRGNFSLPVDQVGSAWTRKAQVDVVGINSMEKTLVLGECKWQLKPVGQRVLQDLVKKTAEIIPPQRQWRVFYLGFAREGWTEAAQLFADSFRQTAVAEGTNWQPVGMKLLDLNQVDGDLESWAQRA
jgi:hypothetical protein